MNKIFLIGALICLSISLKAQYKENEVDLKGNWRFSISGADMYEWADPVYDDSDWDEIKVPDTWENQGFNGYNGYAWYRKTFWIPESFENRSVVIELGYIDDVDEVFFNGQKIGQTGSFPPNYSSAYSSQRKYSIPTSLIKINQKNCIAVKIYDAQLEGGITRGNIKLVAGEVVIKPDIDMSGEWDFRIGASKRKTATIIVPGNWENQGFNSYDGTATYSRIVNVPASMANKKLIFLAGRIDDDDEFYINGKLVGRSGSIDGTYYSDIYKEFRNYFIPSGVIQPGPNLIEIKVMDRGGEGGIIEGSVGLITQENFIKFWRMRRRN